MVGEGKEEWAKRVGERRREQALPLPSIEWMVDVEHIVRSVIRISNNAARHVVSFI